ncbi:hypothetical protein [Arthrobacter woluwensis]|uniref:Uncharacterized conserved protein YukE n=2 Tax=Arthrobacter TaxID=1663 RepID=A0A1H4VW28_9MICC|nr:hypothetical protein [Arthrobacter woluwensis]SEC85203.1 Uncharacterized conserved protein YukE [Arthrobacter woluwensis]
MSLFGMDVEQGKAFGKKLDQGADRLAQLSKDISSSLASSPWKGPDADGFKSEWNGHRHTLTAASHALHAAARTMREQVREQEVASKNAGDGRPHGGGGGNPFEQAWNWVINDSHSPVHNLVSALGQEASALGNFGHMAWNSLIHAEPPSLTELVAGGALLVGSTLNLAATTNTLGLANPHLFDDGTPYAGDPQFVGVYDPASHGKQPPLIDGHQNTPLPTNLANILRGVTATYDDTGKSGVPDNAVRITTVDKGDGPAYIVSIPGTQNWNPLSGSDPMDLTGNLETASGNLSTMSQSVRLAMENAGIPEGAPVMLVGHSQGGMTAAALAADSGFRDRFNLTNVITYGSPVDSTHIPDSVNTLEIQHETDVVPQLDLGNAKPLGPLVVPWTRDNSGTVVTLPNPPGVGPLDAAGNHDFNNYANSVERYANTSDLSAYQNDPSTQRFITDDLSQVSSTVSNIGRRQ